jgi:hypothetical protein
MERWYTRQDLEQVIDAAARVEVYTEFRHERVGPPGEAVLEPDGAYVRVSKAALRETLADFGARGRDVGEYHVAYDEQTATLRLG